MRKSSLSSALTAALALAVGPLAAEPGFYAGFAGGWTTSDVSAGEIQEELAAAGFPNTTSLDDEDFGFKIHAGYRINPYFAVEGGYVDLGEIKADSVVSGGNPGTINSTLDNDGFFLGALGGYPISDEFFAYAKAGLIFWDGEAESRANLVSGSSRASSSDDGTDFAFGLGASYRFSEQVGVRVDWDRYQLGGDVDADVDLFSLGIQLHF